MKKNIINLITLLSFLIVLSCDNQDFVNPYDITSSVSQPANFQITQLSLTSCKLSWEDKCGIEEGFIISRKRDNEAWVEDYAILEANSEELIEEDLEIDRLYRYRLKVYYEEINSDYLERSINTKGAPPSNLTITQLTSSVNLTWENDCLWNEGFVLYRNGGEIAMLEPSVHTYTDADLDFGSYEYFLTALYLAGESDPSNTVEVTFSLNEWITKGAYQTADGIGTGSAAVIDVSQKFYEHELYEYQGCYIKSIKFIPRESSASFTIKIWGGYAGSTELYSQRVNSFTNSSWNEVVLTSPFAIPSGGPLYIGYEFDTLTGYPAGCDSGPAVEGGDMIKLAEEATWDILSGITSFSINWNIQAFVSSDGSNKVGLTRMMK